MPNDKSRLKKVKKKVRRWKKEGYDIEVLDEKIRDLNIRRSALIVIVIIVLILSTLGFNTLLFSVNEKVDFEESALICFWDFDEDSGTTVYDSSGNNNQGTIIGASWTTGYFDSALSFDGVDDYITVSHNSQLAPTNGITISCWLKLESFPSGWPYHAAIIGKGGYDVGSGYELEVSYDTGGQGNRMLMWRAFPGGVMTELGIDYSTYLKEWHFLTSTCDDTHIKLYIDGILISEKNCSGSLLQNDHSLYIGRRDPANHFDKFLDGIIDEIRIYNRALNEDEILVQYNNLSV